MAYVTIPKDLTKVKSKVLFGLTKRQLICFGAAALIGVPLFFLLRRTASNSAAAFCMIIVMLPFFLLAMYMPPQKRLAAMISLLGWKKDMIPLPVMPASGYLAEKSNELLLREQS